MTKDEALTKAFQTAFELDLDGMSALQALKLINSFADILMEVYNKGRLDAHAEQEQAKQGERSIGDKVSKPFDLKQTWNENDDDKKYYKTIEVPTTAAQSMPTPDSSWAEMDKVNPVEGVR